MSAALCIASGKLLVKYLIPTFTLAWTHSVEKILWDEDWRITKRDLVLVEGRMRGSGAGMDPPDGSVLKDGVWHYRVKRVLPSLDVAHSPFVKPYRLCYQGHCALFADLLPGLPAEATIELRPCDSTDPTTGQALPFPIGLNRKE